MKCTRCGECCKGPEIVIYEADIIRWKNEGRIDILKQLSLSKTKESKEYLAGFIDEDGNETYRCPFLSEKGNTSECSIYNARPDTCKKNPKIDIPVCNKEEYLKAAVMVCS